MTSKTYYLRNTFCKAYSCHSDSSDGSGAKSIENFWKGFTILHAKRNIHNLREDVKISTLTGVWKKLIPIRVDDFNGEINCRCGRNSKRPRIRTELLQSHNKALTGKELDRKSVV